jgi:hypothetical protein
MENLLEFLQVGFLTFLSCTLFASLFEWALHRFVMHKPVPTPLGKFDYAFRAHAIVHHGIFKSDHTYHLIKEDDKSTIPMAWWNGPVLIAVGTCCAMLIAWITNSLHWHNGWSLHPWVISITALATIAAYYGTYEYIHWCMHLPKARRLEKSWLFYRLNGHHLLHHRYMHKNFNVVLPFADLILGTLILRSKIKFPQAKGPSVPDVQPRESRKIPFLETP